MIMTDTVAGIPEDQSSEKPESQVAAVEEPALWLRPEGQRSAVTTAHGTLVFFKLPERELRHGHKGECPHNVILVTAGGWAEFMYVPPDGRLRRLELPAHGEPSIQAYRFRLTDNATATGTSCNLSANGVFLCAETDGRLSVSRSRADDWECFVLVPSIQLCPAPYLYNSNATLSAGAARNLPIAFYPSGQIALDSDGVPYVKEAGKSQCSGFVDHNESNADVTIVVRDPNYIGHYFHFMEILIAAFSFHQEYMQSARIARIVFGAQTWRGSLTNDVQKQMIDAIYGDIEIIEDKSGIYDSAEIYNILVVDRFRSHSSINKFLDQMQTEARVWMPEMRRLVMAAVVGEWRPAPLELALARCAYVHRGPPPDANQILRGSVISDDLQGSGIDGRIRLWSNVLAGAGQAYSFR